MSGLVAVDAPIDVSSIEPTQLVAALVVLLTGWLLSRYTRRAVAKVLVRVPGITDPVKGITARLAGYLVLFVGFGIALAILGAAIQPLLAVAIIVGVVLFLALRGIADNIAAGVLLQTRRPITIGDEIEVSGQLGEVIEMNSRAVVIATYDGRQVHIPNADLLQNPLSNNTQAGARRSDIEVRCAAGPEHSQKVMGEVLETARGASGVLDDPLPTVFATSIEKTRVTLLLRVWHDPTVSRTAVSSVVVALGEMGARTGTEISVISPPAEAALTPPASV